MMGYMLAALLEEASRDAQRAERAAWRKRRKFLKRERAKRRLAIHLALLPEHACEKCGGSGARFFGDRAAEYLGNCHSCLGSGLDAEGEKKRAEMLAAPISSTLPEPMSNMKKLSPAQELALALLAEGVGYESSHTIHGKHRWIAKSTAESLVKLGYASFRRERANLDDLGGHGDKHPRIIEIADAGKKYVETHRVVVPRKEV